MLQCCNCMMSRTANCTPVKNNPKRPETSENDPKTLQKIRKHLRHQKSSKFLPLPPLQPSSYAAATATFQRSHHTARQSRRSDKQFSTGAQLLPLFIFQSTTAKAVLPYCYGQLQVMVRVPIDVSKVATGLGTLLPPLLSCEVSPPPMNN